MFSIILEMPSETEENVPVISTTRSCVAGKKSSVFETRTLHPALAWRATIDDPPLPIKHPASLFVRRSLIAASLSNETAAVSSSAIQVLCSLPTWDKQRDQFSCPPAREKHVSTGRTVRCRKPPIQNKNLLIPVAMRLNITKNFTQES